MRHDSDVILIGTGVAPLVAAAKLMAEGRSVLVLNPDSDFFQEDSEFPLDRLQSLTSDQVPGLERFKRSTLDETLGLLRPDFPGPIEKWISDQDGAAVGGSQYHDPFAPHVRARQRLWVARKDDEIALARMDQMASQATLAGLHPRRLDGILSVARFPGHALSSYGGSPKTPSSGFVPEDWCGLLLPRVTDIDVNRYRNGLLGFVRERLGDNRIFSRVSDIDFLPERAIRFHAGGQARTARYHSGLIVFWTPLLSRWIAAQSRKRLWNIPAPVGIRLWEQWSILSREAVDPTIVGCLGDMIAWADVEGVPNVLKEDGTSERGVRTVRREAIRMDEDRGASNAVRTRLTVLRPALLSEVGPDGGYRSASLVGARTGWISSDSFQQLERLCREFLGWSRFSVRGLRTRATLEWKGRPPVVRVPDLPGCWIASGVDGPLPKVVETARKCSQRILDEELTPEGLVP